MKVVRAILVMSLFSTGLPGLAQQSPDPSPTTAQTGPLTLDQILANLEQRNAQRAAALERFEGTRVYRMEYRGFPSDRDAEMTVKFAFQAPSSKQFTVVSQTGSKFVIDHIFKKLLEGEQEAAKGDNRNDTALTRKNYDFEFAAMERNPEGDQYVLKLLPKNRNKFLYRGTIWVDAKDFAVTRIQGEPGKNPSIWIKKTDITHSYKKVDDFWLPAENHTESFIRIGGKATLSIEDRDYRIIKASSPHSAKTRAVQHRGDPNLDGAAISERNIWNVPPVTADDFR
jgi:outer membrane lipoprotein-sorting protein